MNVHIPQHDQLMTLTKKWTFTLQFDSRSKTLWAKLLDRPKMGWRDFYRDYNFRTREIIYPQGWQQPREVALPRGTVVSLDTFHMLRGHTPQVVLRVRSCPDKKLAKTKFAVTVDDFNRLHFKSPEPIPA